MINTCIWFQWLPERVEKRQPASRRESSSRELMQSESERTTAEEESETPPKKSLVYVVLKVLFCVIKHLFCGLSPLTSSSFLPPDPRTLRHWCRNPGRGSRYSAIMQPAMSREWSTWWCWSSSSPDYPGGRLSGSGATARRCWVRPSSWRRTIWRRAPGSASPGLISLSLPSHLLLSLAQSQLPGCGCRWPLEPRHGVGMDRATITPGEGGGGRAHHLSTVLSPAIPCPPFCRGGGGKAWADLLEMRGPGALPGPLSHDGGGIAGPGPRLSVGCPRSSRAVPDTCEYQGGYISGLGWFRL